MKMLEAFSEFMTRPSVWSFGFGLDLGAFLVSCIICHWWFAALFLGYAVFRLRMWPTILRWRRDDAP